MPFEIGEEGTAAGKIVFVYMLLNYIIYSTNRPIVK